MSLKKEDLKIYAFPPVTEKDKYSHANLIEMAGLVDEYCRQKLRAAQGKGQHPAGDYVSADTSLEFLKQHIDVALKNTGDDEKKALLQEMKGKIKKNREDVKLVLATVTAVHTQQFADSRSSFFSNKPSAAASSTGDEKEHKPK